MKRSHDESGVEHFSAGGIDPGRSPRCAASPGRLPVESTPVDNRPFLIRSLVTDNPFEHRHPHGDAVLHLIQITERCGRPPTTVHVRS
jgi:anti-sigma factor ChrR (cupin superfamily)